MHSHHDKTRGWQPFWAALGAALLVLLPLVGGTILLTRQSLRTRLAAKPQSGVAVRMPKTENQLTLLVCTAGEQPGFVLLYLNASQNCIRLAALPAETAIPFGQGEATLAHSSELLTDLTAQDLLTLESTLEFLANGNAAVFADALPGAWNPTRRFYGLTDASRASVQTLFNVWPTEAQAASSSEP